MAWPFQRNNSVRKHSLDELAATESELSRFLLKLGYNPRRTAQARGILAELKTGIRTQISDFPAFQERLRSAAQCMADEPQITEADRQFIDEILRASGDKNATLAILNRDPVGQRIPFVELVPVKRGSGTTWLAPVAEPSVVKRPLAPTRYSDSLSELTELFRDPDPAIQDEARVNLLYAVRRVKRELDRESSYLLPAIQLLESRLDAYESSGQDPQCRSLLEVVRRIIGDVESVRAQSSACDPSRTQLRKAVEQYLCHPKLYGRWMTNYLVENLLAPTQLQGAYGRSAHNRKTVQLVRAEVAAGKYCAPEIVRRLRDLERSGLYFSTLVYELLATQDNRIPSGSPSITRASRQI